MRVTIIANYKCEQMKMVLTTMIDLLRAKGVTMQGQPAGHQYVHMNVTVPKVTSGRQKELLEEFEKLEKEKEPNVCFLVSVIYLASFIFTSFLVYFIFIIYNFILILIHQ